jgi:hypothetical protein
MKCQILVLLHLLCKEAAIDIVASALHGRRGKLRAPLSVLKALFSESRRANHKAYFGHAHVRNGQWPCGSCRQFDLG